jgi:cobalamin biosynthesis protein CobW
MSIEKTPVTIVTGFLGSGKTTLIRHLLQNPQGKRIAVLVNEFGDVGVDGAILKDCAIDACPPGETPGEIVELTNGCLCCTVADDFVPTIEALMARSPKPDHIVIETSGLALPKPLLKAFDWPSLRTRITVDGVLAVADAEAVAAGRFAPDPEAVAAQRLADDSLDHETPLSELFEDQIACADIVILNKADLVDADRLAAARAAVEAETPRPVSILEAVEGRLDPRILIGLGAAAEDDLHARPSHHDGEDDHDHDDFETFVLDIPEIGDPASFARALERLGREAGVLRAKGYLAVAGKPMRLLVQGVGGRVRWQFDRPWGAEPRRGQLVVIGEHDRLDRAAVEAGVAADAA